MSRGARVQSRSAIYHVILRGINRQQIFLDAEDNNNFLYLLKRFKSECNFELFAYCLMGNHVHLLLKTEKTPLSLIMQKINGAYVYRFNNKYERSGHLFQDRFRSEVVENELYFMTVLRYIIQNPVKAGLCIKAEEYEYSSMKAYCGKTDNLTDIKFANEIYRQGNLLHFLREKNDDKCLEISDHPRHGMMDQQAMQRIKAVLGDFPDLSKENRALLSEQIQVLHEEGISIRQLSRLSGIPKGLIEKCL